MQISFTLNGEKMTIEDDGQTPMLWILRDELDMTGTKFGCGKAFCGACTIHVDGQAVRACAFPVKFANGKRIRTIENLEADSIGAAVTEAWIEKDVVQCGWCQPGQCMAAAALLAEKSKPTDEEIDAALSGNICRCGTYPRIREAVHMAAEKLESNNKE